MKANQLDNFAAELTRAAYGVALRHGTAGTWLDLELDLWRALADTVKQWGRESPPGSEAAFACDWAGPCFCCPDRCIYMFWAGGRSEAAHGDGRDGLGRRRFARLSLSGE
jgi:hypothetical protein